MDHIRKRVISKYELTSSLGTVDQQIMINTFNSTFKALIRTNKSWYNLQPGEKQELRFFIRLTSGNCMICANYIRFENPDVTTAEVSSDMVVYKDNLFFELLASAFIRVCTSLDYMIKEPDALKLWNDDRMHSFAYHSIFTNENRTN